MGWIIPLLNFLGSLFKLFADRQLIEAGKKELQNDIYRAEEEAIEQVDAIVKNIDSLPVNTVNERLSKWERD